MKLYLSSYYLGNPTQILQDMVGQNKRAAVIANSIDFLTGSERSQRVGAEIATLRELGFQSEELDLRNYFDSSEGLKQKLSEYGLLMLRGGNVFVLRRALAQSGFDEIIAPLLKEDKLVYAGYSAGACVVAPDLRGLELADDPNIIPDGYNPEIIWQGLGLVDFAIAPKYNSDNPEAAAVEHITDYFNEHNVLFKVLPAGEVIVIDGENQKIIS